MARLLSRQTKQLLRGLFEAGPVVSASGRYWGKAGAARFIKDFGQDFWGAVDAAHAHRALMRLRARGWVAGQHNRIELTPEGRAAATQIALEDLQLKRPATWDGLWRIVIWDIPEKRRFQRDTVRRTLARLGFIRIQQSVWVTPLPCQEEIASLRSKLGIKQGLLYLESGKIEGERLLRQHFKVG